MPMPKITIKKKVMLDNKGHHRYYSPLYDRRTKLKVGAPVYDLSDLPSDYVHINVKTEKELCWFIYNKFGEGEYRFIGHLKGRCGAWTFWRGEINSEGFSSTQKKVRNTRYINNLKTELKDIESAEEKSDILEEIEIEGEVNAMVKYGFTPFIKPSGRRGDFINWSDPEPSIIKEEFKNEEAVW